MPTSKFGAYNPCIGQVKPDADIQRLLPREPLDPATTQLVLAQLQEAREVAIRRSAMEVTFTAGPRVADPAEVASQTADLILSELGTMMVEPTEVLLEKLSLPFTVVVFSGDDPKLVVGFATLFALTDGWYELRALVVRNHGERSFRDRGIATEIVWEVLRQARHHLGDDVQIMATLKHDFAINAVILGGMRLAPFETLPLGVRVATCICKGDGEGGSLCQKAGKGCRLALIHRHNR